jgi:hypothetical protein
MDTGETDTVRGDPMTQFLLALGIGFTSMAFLGALGAYGAGTEADKSQRVMRAFKTNTPIPLDGDLRKWRDAESVSIEGRPLAGHPRHATIYALWDAKNLYLAFDVRSCRLKATVRERDGDKLWEDDGIEFLIDAHRDKSQKFLSDDFSYHINILNAVYDDRVTPSGEPDEKWNGTAQHAVKILDDYHYIVEVAIPWKEVGIEPRENQTSVGTDFCVNGKDPATDEYVFYDWCGLKVFHDPSGYGDLVLVGPRDH